MTRHILNIYIYIYICIRVYVVHVYYILVYNTTNLRGKNIIRVYHIFVYRYIQTQDHIYHIERTNRRKGRYVIELTYVTEENEHSN